MQDKNNIGEIYNIATNCSHKISDIIKIVSQITKKKPLLNVIKQRKRSSEVFELKGSNNKLFKKTRWKPKYSNKSGFKKALNETLRWFKDEENMKHYNNVNNYHI